MPYGRNGPPPSASSWFVVSGVAGQTGQEPAPRAHRRPRERVRAARVWEGRRHLGDAVTEAVVHDGDDHCRDHQASEACRRQAEVPAVVVAGDDGADAERPEHPHTGMPPEAPLLEVLLVHLLIGDRPDFSLCHVPPLLWRRRTFAAVLSLERVIHVKQTSVRVGGFAGATAWRVAVDARACPTNTPPERGGA